MISRKTMGVLAIAVVLIVPASRVWAAPEEDAPLGKKMFKERIESRMQKLFEELNVTEEQRSLLKANKEKIRDQGRALRRETQEKMDLMRQELEKKELDMEKINQIQNEIKAVQARMIDARLESILEVRKILTPEQFNAFMVRMQEKRGEFRQKKGKTGEFWHKKSK